MDPPRQLPELEVLPDLLHHTFVTPAKRINDGTDVARFLVSKAYRDIGTFVLQLNRAVCPRKKTLDGSAVPTVLKTFTIGPPRHVSRIEENLLLLLRRVNTIVDEAPLDPGPRRFGNVSFRKWHGLLEDRADALLRDCVRLGPRPFRVLDTPGEEPGEDQRETKRAEALQELKPYFIGSFDSPQRLDYGTGHELSFLAFLACLWKLGCFNDNGVEERGLVLNVFET